MAAREVSSDEPTGTTHPIGHCASLKKSWFRTEASAISENDPGAGKEHIKLGWSQSIFSNAEPFCVQPGWKPLRCAAMASEPGVARLAHQIARVKRIRRLQAVIFLNDRCTKIIITLCSLEVNPLSSTGFRKDANHMPRSRGFFSLAYKAMRAALSKNEAVSFPELGSEVPVFLAL